MLSLINQSMIVNKSELGDAEKILNHHALVLVDGIIYKMIIDLDTVRAFLQAQEVIPKEVEFLNDFARHHLAEQMRKKRAREANKRVTLSLVPKMT